MSVTLNGEAFGARLQILLNAWNNVSKSEDFKTFAGVDAIFLPAGDPAAEDEITGKGTAFQTWLLGYEFPSTFMLFQKTKVTFLCSTSKAKILSQLKDSTQPLAIEILPIAKANQPQTDAFPTFLAQYTSHSHVGSLAKEEPRGKMMNEWNAALAGEEKGMQVSDITPAISAILAVKDEEELRAIRIAANLTTTLLTHYVAPKLETILDREAQISHETFSAQIESRLGSGEGEAAKGPDQKVWSKGKGLQDVDWGAVEFVYSPIIQSQKTEDGYDLRTSATSSKDEIAHKGVFLVSLGMRNKGYCSNMTRSFIVDPSKEQEENYNILLRLQADILAIMKDGTPAKDIYNHALAFFRKHKSDLVSHVPKNVGFLMGLEFREASYLLSSKTERTLKADMVFNLSLGLQNLEDAGGKPYALQLADTVKITAERGVCLTEGIKQSQDVLFFLNSEPQKAKKAPKATPQNGVVTGSPLKNKVAGNKVLRNKTRSNAQEEAAHSAAAKLVTHQRDLHEARQREGLAKYSEEGKGGGGKEGKSWRRFQSYKSEAALPADVQSLRIYVDKRNHTIVLPINGFAVPFHINSIKNAVKNEEGEFTLLRINLQTPGQSGSKREDTPFEDPDATFVRSLSYRSSDSSRFENLCASINDLKKEVTKRELQKKEMADVVDQDNIIEVKGRRPLRLQDVLLRPALDGKRLPGEIELHQNGLKYQALSTHKMDLLYSNIKHVFFQPCENELVVIIHIHLKAPIMIGKKKSKDVQFYKEASDMQFDETGNRKRKYRYGDEDEIELEQQERRRRAQLNKEFKAYAEKLVEAISVSIGETFELDIPFRELGFEGVPHRTNVRLQPTTEALVHLSEPPFLVVTLSEIEVVSLERVQFGLKQFDMVIIFNDFSRSPHQINSIPTGQLDDVRNWLDSVDIPFGEGPVNLNWAPIMKMVNDDPYGFFQGGGWNFLPGPSQEGNSESESSTSESDFEDEEEVFAESESSSEASSFAASDASDDEASGSDFDDDSEGDDWDELEKKAAKSDKKHRERAGSASADSDGGKPKKKSQAKSNGKARR